MQFTVVANSFVHELVLPRVAAEASCSVRGLTVASSRMAEYVARADIDAVVSVGSALRLPELWSNERVGELWYGLFAAPHVADALGPRPTAAALRALPFVGPLDISTAGAIESGDDRCPLRDHGRVIRHEVETIRLACLVAAESEALVFGPIVAARSLVSTGALVEIDVPGWSIVEPVHLGCNPATVSMPLRALVSRLLESIFAPLRSASGIVSTIDPDNLTSDDVAHEIEPIFRQRSR